MNPGTQVGHCKQDECDQYIGRGRSGSDLRHMNNTSIGERGWLGNPYPLDDGYTRDQSIELFTRDLLDRIDDDLEFIEALADLKGSTLGCWCRSVDEDEPACHGDVLARAIDGLQPVGNDG